MDQKYFRTGWFGAIAILFIYANAYAISYFDPYKLAEDRITEILSENPDIIDRLEVYGQQANELREKIKPAVGPSHFVIEHKDSLTAVVGTVKGKSGILIVESVYPIAKQILIFDEELGKISTSNDLSTDFSRLIENDGYLSKDEHQIIMSHVSLTKSGLIDARYELQIHSERLHALFSNSTIEDAKILFCVFQASCNSYQAWKGLPDTLDQILEHMNSDISTLEIINSQYEDLAAHDRGLTSFLLRLLAKWIIKSKIVLFTLLICLTVGVYSWVRTPSIRQSWWNWISTSKKTIIGRKTNQIYPSGLSMPVTFKTDEKFSDVKIKYHSRLNLFQGEKSRQTQALLVCNFVEGERYIVGVPDIGKLTIGSNNKADVLTSSSESAKSQLMLKYAKTVFYLEVLDYTFPTKLNGQTITGARELNSGDIITVGNLSALYLEKNNVPKLGPITVNPNAPTNNASR